MSKKGMGLLVAGAAALLLMGGKKKKKAGSGSGSGSGSDNGTSSGDDIVGPGGKTTDDNGGSGAGGSEKPGKDPGTKRPGGGYNPPNLASDAIWVSGDCKRVFFAKGRIGTPSAADKWLESKVAPAVPKFIKAGYKDPYEVARQMLLGMAPCVAEFPLASEATSPGQLEYDRETFLRKYRDVYHLIMLVVPVAQEEMGLEQNMITFDSKRCDVTFVGDKWGRPVAEQMAQFYLNYMYPVASDYGHEKKYPASLTSDVNESTMVFADNIAVAIINRFDPRCGSELAEAFKKEPFTASSYFSVRPGLKALYDNLVDLVNYVDNNRGGLDFKPEAIKVS